MEWKKTSEAVADAFAAALPDDPRVERRKMFGYPAAFVGGNMFAGTFHEDVVLRLPEAEQREAMAAGGAPFEPMGRPMTGFVLAPAAALSDRAALSGWLAKALAHGASMPAKEKKPSNPKLKRSAAKRA